MGSSQRRIGAPVTSARAIEVRCISPPDSWPGRWSRRSTSPKWWRSRSISIRPSRSDLPAIRSGSSTFSSTVRVASRLKNWKTKPISSRRSTVRPCSSRSLIGRPATSNNPDDGTSSPDSNVRSVVFPEPLGPMIATNSCLRTSKFTSSRTGILRPRTSWNRYTPCARSAGTDARSGGCAAGNAAAAGAWVAGASVTGLPWMVWTPTEWPHGPFAPLFFAAAALQQPAGIRRSKRK